MEKLLLYLPPIILLSAVGVRQSLLYNGIAVPVMILWVINALLALMPERLERQYEAEPSLHCVENRARILEEPEMR